MSDKVKFPVYFRAMGGVNVLLSLIAFLVSILGIVQWASGNEPNVQGAYVVSTFLALGVIALICTVNWLFGMRGSYSCLILQLLAYVPLIIIMAFDLRKVEGGRDILAVLLFVIVFHIAFLTVGLFFKPVKNWLSQFENSNAIKFNKSILIPGILIVLLLPGSIFLLDNVITRDATAVPDQISYYSTVDHSTEARVVIDNQRGTAWQTTLVPNSPNYIQLNFTTPEILRKVVVNGTVDWDSWKEYNRLKDLSLKINDSISYDFVLDDIAGDQILEFDQIAVTSITLIPRSVYPGTSNVSDVFLASFKGIKQQPFFEKTNDYAADNVYVVEVPPGGFREASDEDLEGAGHVIDWTRFATELPKDELHALYIYVAENWVVRTDWSDLFYSYGEPVILSDGGSHGMFFGGQYSLFEFAGGLNSSVMNATGEVTASSAWSSLAGLPLYLSEVEPGSSTEFNHVNPEFVTWASMYLIPDPDDVIFGAPCQEYYDKVFLRLFRMMVETYVYLDEQGIEQEANRYRDAMGADFYAPEYLFALYGNAVDGYEIPEDHEQYNEYYLPPHAIGFWLRRSLDGSARTCWGALNEVMEKYDNEWLQNHLPG